LREDLTGLRRDVREPGCEQASLAMQVGEAIMRAAQMDRRLDDQRDGQPAGD